MRNPDRTKITLADKFRAVAFVILRSIISAMRKDLSEVFTRIELIESKKKIVWDDLKIAINEISSGDFPDEAKFAVYRSYNTSRGVAGASIRVRKSELMDASAESKINFRLESEAVDEID